MEYHPRAAETHHRTYLLTHIRTVAVDTAIGTEGFIFHDWAMVDACVGVAFEGFTLRAEAFFGVMNLFAI